MGLERFTNRIEEIRKPKEREVARPLSPAHQRSVERQSNREFWTIRAGFLGMSCILSGLEIYLNYVIFSGLVALVGVSVGAISTGTIILASFLGRSPNKKIRRTAKGSDWIGLAVIACLVSVWWYGMSSIETAGHQVKEWEANSTSYNAAVAKSRADLRAGVADYNACRNRPVASFAREERASAIAACEQVAHTAADFPVTVPDPGPRPKDSEGSVAADWKPAFRGFGIAGLGICVLTFGLLITFAQAPAVSAVSVGDQAAVLGQIRTGRATEWPLLSRHQFKQSAVLGKIRTATEKTWPVTKTAFCSRLVNLSPSPLMMAQSLLKRPVVCFTAPIIEAGKGLEPIIAEMDTVPVSQAVTIGTASDCSTVTAETVTTVPELEIVTEDFVTDEKRATVIICAGQYKLVPRKPDGWKLLHGTTVAAGQRYIASITPEEGERILEQSGLRQSGVVSEILMKKGKGSPRRLTKSAKG